MPRESYKAPAFRTANLLSHWTISRYYSLSPRI